MSTLFEGHGWQFCLESVPLPDGRTKTMGRAKRADSVHILAFPKDKAILILREYRPFYKEYLWMLPSGKADKETDPAIAAQRELQEETGFRAKVLLPYCAARHSESLIATNYFFIARELERAPLPKDDDEMIEVHELPLQKALEAVQSCTHVHMASAYGLLRYMHEHPIK